MPVLHLPAAKAEEGVVVDAFVLENVTCGYGEKPVLRTVTLRVPSGAFAGIIGPNGCGKTTLLRAMTGIVPCAAGRVLLDGQELRRMSAREIACRVAVVAQEITVDTGFLVEELVLMGRTPHVPWFGSERSSDFAAVRRAMEIAEIQHLGPRPVNELSVGERQRVFIAMALAQEAAIFLLDEPTMHLDIGHQTAVLNIFTKLNSESGATVVAVLHDLNLAFEYCSHVVLLSGGRVAAFGAPAEVITEDRVKQVYGASSMVTRNPISGKPLLVTAAEGLGRS
jgi:iron complex transport system ATP-binding protein